MRTGGHSRVYRDHRQDWTIYDDSEPVGRIYEDTSAFTSADLRWFWLITTHTECGHSHERQGTNTRRGEECVAAHLDCLEQCAAAIVTERLASPRLARPPGASSTGARQPCRGGGDCARPGEVGFSAIASVQGSCMASAIQLRPI